MSSPMYSRNNGFFDADAAIPYDAWQQNSPGPSSATVDQPTHIGPEMTSLRSPAAVGVDGRLPRRFKSHEMDEFLKGIYPHAKTPQERMRECNIDLLRMANEAPYPEYAAPAATGDGNIFSDLLDPSAYSEPFGEWAQCEITPQEFENPPSAYPSSHYLIPPAIEVDQTYATNYDFLHADSGMESVSSAMGSFEDSPSNYTSSDYPTPPEFQASGTHIGNSLSVGSSSSQPSPASVSSPLMPDHRLSRIPRHQAPNADQAEATAPLVMVLNAKNMSTVAQRTRAKYTPAKRKEVHDTRKRGAFAPITPRIPYTNKGEPLLSLGDFETPLVDTVEPDTSVDTGLSPFPPESDFILFPEEMDYRFSPSQMNMDLIATTRRSSGRSRPSSGITRQSIEEGIDQYLRRDLDRPTDHNPHDYMFVTSHSPLSSPNDVLGYHDPHIGAWIPSYQDSHFDDPIPHFEGIPRDKFGRVNCLVKVCRRTFSDPLRWERHLRRCRRIYRMYCKVTDHKESCPGQNAPEDHEGALSHFAPHVNSGRLHCPVTGCESAFVCLAAWEVHFRRCHRIPIRTPPSQGTTQGRIGAQNSPSRSISSPISRPERTTFMRDISNVAVPTTSNSRFVAERRTHVETSNQSGIIINHLIGHPFKDEVHLKRPQLQISRRALLDTGSEENLLTESLLGRIISNINQNRHQQLIPTPASRDMASEDSPWELSLGRVISHIDREHNPYTLSAYGLPAAKILRTARGMIAFPHIDAGEFKYQWANNTPLSAQNILKI
ncbi:hypothetical protein FGG08_004055 [Glutinoglossum americanum]|uniref:Uncharacterized protein n=1 Tax=Glutinoglossum americanum TaxID=1670608 RepID=A0A9P8L486_9PEZI|nr:hypothetical protein FGG08_004055 [Glutinoglossum americanum]